MKKLLLTVFAFSVAFVTSAQISKGTILAGASSNLGFNSYKVKDADESSKSFDVDLKGGYFFIDNLAAGIHVGLSTYSFGDTKDTETSMGLFARYYVQGKIFIGAGFDANKVKTDDGTTETKYSYNTINLEAGYAAFLTDNIAVEPSLNYGMDSGDAEGAGFGINVGFTLYLNRK